MRANHSDERILVNSCPDVAHFLLQILCPYFFNSVRLLLRLLHLEQVRNSGEMRWKERGRGEGESSRCSRVSATLLIYVVYLYGSEVEVRGRKRLKWNKQATGRSRE